MKLRILVLAVAIAAALAAVMGAAGAGARSARHTAAPPAHHSRLTTVAAIKRYLHTQGVKTTGLVVQRGARNYAGPKCPGAGWTCTTAKRVIQMSTNDAPGQNRSDCSASYGTPGQPVNYPPQPSGSVGCTIVQVGTTANNSAHCTIRSTLNPITEYCAIHQESTTGRNDAQVDEAITQKSNDTDQTQTGETDAYVEQYSTTGANSFTGHQSVDQDVKAKGFISQLQQPTTNLSVTQNSNSGGRNSAHADQSVNARGQANGQVSGGSQEQDSTLLGSITQNSVDVSAADVQQNESLDLKAPKDSGVTQDQFGPMRCCENQSSNPADTFSLSQNSVASASSPSSTQVLDQEGHCDSSGTCNVTQKAKTDTGQSTNTCTGSFCDIFNDCESGGGEASTQASSSGTCFPSSGGGYFFASRALRRAARLSH